MPVSALSAAIALALASGSGAQTYRGPESSFKGAEMSLAFDVACPRDELRKTSSAVVTVELGKDAPVAVIAPVDAGAHEDTIAAHMSDELNDRLERTVARVLAVNSGPDRLTVTCTALGAELRSPEADSCHHLRLTVEVAPPGGKAGSLAGVLFAPNADPKGESLVTLALSDAGTSGQPALTAVGVVLPPGSRPETFAHLAHALTLRGWPAEATSDGVRIPARDGRRLLRLAASIEPATRSSRGTAPGFQVRVLE